MSGLNEDLLIARGEQILWNLYSSNDNKGPLYDRNIFFDVGLHEVRGENATPINARDLDRMNYLAAIVCVMWAIENQTPEEHKFERGSWKISDVRLAEFLKGYYDYANPERLGSISLAEGQLTAANNLVYSRDPTMKLSSHYKKDKDQHGIDIRFHPQDDSCFILPPSTDRRSHILFGEVATQKANATFLKFEMYGLGDSKQMMAHALEFLHGGTHDGTMRREKDFPGDYKQKYQEFCKILQINPKTEYQDAAMQVTDLMFGQPEDKAKHGFTCTVTGKAARLYEEMAGIAGNASLITGNEVVLELKNKFTKKWMEDEAPEVLEVEKLKSIEDIMKKFTTKAQYDIYLPGLIMRASEKEISSLKRNFLTHQVDGQSIAVMLYSTEEGKKALCKLLDYAPQLDWPDEPLGQKQSRYMIGTFFSQGLVVKCRDLQCRDIQKKTRTTDLYKAVAKTGNEAAVAKLLEGLAAQDYYDYSAVQSDTILSLSARSGNFGIFSMILDKYTKNQQEKTFMSSNPLSGIREANPSGNGTAFNVLISHLDRLDRTNPAVTLPDTYYDAVDKFLTCLREFPPGAQSYGMTGKGFSGSIGVEDAFGMTPIERIFKSGDVKLLEILEKNEYLKLFDIDQNKATNLMNMIPSDCKKFRDMFSKDATNAGINLIEGNRTKARA